MIKSYIRTRMIVLLSFLLFTSNIYSLVVMPEVKVKNEVVTLKDIVITWDEALLNEFKKVELGRIRVPGGRLVVRRDSIMAHLISQGYRSPDLNIPERVIIERVYQSISRSELQDIIKNQLNKIYLDTDYEYTISLSGGQLIRMPVGNLEYTIDNANYNRGLGRKNLDLLIYEHGREVYRIPFGADIGRVVRDYILKKDVKEGEAFSLDLVDVKEEFVYQDTRIRNLSFKEGDVFAVDLLAGTKLSDSHLIQPALVKVGDRIIIYLKFGNMYITDRGRALERGNVGDEIKVENIRTGRIITGKIREDRSIEASIR